MRLRSLFLFGIIVAAADAIAAVHADVVTYPAPAGEMLSKDYAVEVDGKAVPVYLAQTHWHDKKPYSFAYFDFSGHVSVTVKTDRPLNHLAIRPQKYGFHATTRPGKATFEADKPFSISFEPSGTNTPLLLFGNPIELNPPKPGDPNVVYFGPGIHKPVRIDLSAGQTLYIAGGAIVKGAVVSTGDNVRIMGRGVLDGSDWPHSRGPAARMVTPEDGKNIQIRDIVIRGSWNWTVAPSRCDQVMIDNLHICGSRCGNDDGIDPCNSSNVTIRNCFVHTDDDGIAAKGTARLGQEPKATENILVENCTFWVDFANIFRIGAESRAVGLRNFVARDIDVIHSLNPTNPRVYIFYIHPEDNMPMENLVFQDIRINGEDPQNLVRITPMVRSTSRPTAASTREYRGGLRVPGDGPYVHNVIFRNVEIYGERRGAEPVVYLEGLSPLHDVLGVVFDNLLRYGELLTKDSAGIQVGPFVSGVEFLPARTTSISRPSP
jgi:hypothetical protein